MNRTEAVARLRGERVARLATVRPDGRPHVVPVVFAVVERPVAPDRLSVYWIVDHKPKGAAGLQRLRNIAVRPHAELVVDAYDDEDWRRLWWVRVSGASQTVDDPDERTLARDALATKYRQYAADPPQGPVVVIEIDSVAGWRGWR
jgi:PPOX class probable F420-dependent enzyme